MKWSLEQRSELQALFITGIKLICYFVLYYYFPQWARPQNMAIGDLAFYYTLYSCSPRRVSRKLWTVYETVSCMQQLRERYASRTCYYARASLCRQRQGLNYAQSQPTLSSTLMHRF